MKTVTVTEIGQYSNYQVLVHSEIPNWITNKYFANGNPMGVSREVEKNEFYMNSNEVKCLFNY